MTSKNLFIKLMKENSKRRIFNIALVILGMFFALPIYGALSINIWMDRLEWGRTTYEDMAASFSSNITGVNNLFLVTLVFIFAVLIGMNGFSYLFSRQKTDLYHSIPVKRDTMFFVSYFNGILFFAVPYAVMLAFTLIMGKAYRLVNGETLAAAVTACLVTVLCYIMLYTTVILAAMLTGNIIISLLATGVFFAYGPCLKILFWGCHEVFFWGYYNSSYIWDDVNTRYYSPVTLYVNIINALTEHTDPVAGYIIEALIITIVLAVLCLLIYRKRPSEAAGHAIAFPKLCPVVKFLIIIPTAIGSGLFFRDIVSTKTQKDLWFAFGLVFALVLTHAIMEIIFRFDFKAGVKNMRHLAIAFVITAVIAIIFRFDILGYSSYLPKSSSIASIGMDIGSFNSESYYLNMDNYSEDMSDSEFYSSVYQDSEEYFLENLHLTDTETCLALARSGIQYSKLLYASGSRNQLSSLASADEYGTHHYSSVTFCYHLKNGENIYRRYMVDFTENMDLLNRIYTSEEFKNVVYPILSLTDGQAEKLNYHSPLGTYTLDVLTDAEKEELIKTYQKELWERDFYSLAEKGEIPIGYLACTMELGFTNMKYSSSIEYNQGCVFPSFTETIALLRKYKIPIYDYANIDNIANLTVINYNYDDDYMSDALEKIYSDPDEIASLMEYLVPSSYVYRAGIMQSTASDLHITATYKDTPKGFDNTCNFDCLSDSVPDKIRKDLNYNP